MRRKSLAKGSATVASRRPFRFRRETIFPTASSSGPIQDALADPSDFVDMNCPPDRFSREQFRLPRLAGLFTLPRQR